MHLKNILGLKFYQVGYWKKILLRKSDEARQQTIQELMESLALEVIRNHGDVALRDVVSEHGGHGLDIVTLEFFFNANDSVILLSLIDLNRTVLKSHSILSKEWCTQQIQNCSTKVLVYSG